VYSCAYIILYTVEIEFGVPKGCHILPSTEYAKLFPVDPSPPTSHILLPHVTLYAPLGPNIVDPLEDPVQVNPSVENAIVLFPSPVATQREPFHAIDFPRIENGLVVIGNQVIPSVEYAIVFVPSPVAIQREPFQVTAVPLILKILVLFPTGSQFVVVVGLYE
jgi:hypothetical protein